MKDQYSNQVQLNTLVEFYGNGIFTRIVLVGAHLTALHFASLDMSGANGSGAGAFELYVRVGTYGIAFGVTALFLFTCVYGYKIFFMPIAETRK